MCGIAGIFDPRARKDPRGVLERSVASLKHRGPDEDRVWVSADRSMGLGHARLKIIDLSAGIQPMPNEDESLWLVFNGEIYNHQELRDRLVASGHRFRTRTDSEVIVHLFEEEGAGCVDKLRGMFAFALAAPARRTVFLARDRLGKKPLNYAWHEGAFYFCSELAPMVGAMGLPKRMDGEALDLYLSLGYIPAPWSIYGAIRKLEPASTLLVGPDGPGPPSRYWAPRYAPKTAASLDEAAEELRSRLDEASRIRVHADVPVGCFLSGGLDSSAVALSLTGTGCKSFTVSFGVPEFDETPYAVAAAAAAGLDHTVIQGGAGSVETLLPLLARRYGEPFADSSAVPSFLLSAATRKEVTVALCGDGGDELFAGYPRHRAVLALAALPAAARKTSSFAARLAPGRLAARAAELLSLTPLDAFFELNALFGERQRGKYLAGGAAAPRRELAAYRLFSRLDDEARDLPLLDRFLRIDTLTYLPGDLLVKMDIASMAHGLEVRSPLLDQELQAFGAHLPCGYKAGVFQGKRVLRRMLRGRLPRKLLDRPKMGFALPIKAWFTDELSSYMRRRIKSDALQSLGILRPGAVDEMVGEHEAGTAPHQHRLWSLMMLAEWLEQFG